MSEQDQTATESPATLTIDLIIKHLPELKKLHGSFDRLAAAIGVPRRTMCRALGMTANHSSADTVQHVIQAFDKVLFPDGSLKSKETPRPQPREQERDYPLLSAQLAALRACAHAFAALMRQQEIRLRPQDKLELARIILMLQEFTDATTIEEARNGAPLTPEMMKQLATTLKG